MFNDDFTEYIAAQKNGSDAVTTYKLAEKNGLDFSRKNTYVAICV